MERRALFAGIVSAPIAASTVEKARAQASNAFGVVSIRDFGGVGDGVADDSKAIQDALAACQDGRLLVVPQGKFRVTKPLRAKGLVNIIGFSAEASELLFDNDGALSFESDRYNEFDPSQITLRSIGFRCAKSRTRGGSALVDLHFSGGTGGTGKSVTLEDIEITAASEGAGFDCALRLTNARNLKIDGVRIRGDRDARGRSIGIDIGGSDSPVDSFITKVSCYFLHRAINIDGAVEGVYLSQSVFVAVDHGIYGRVPHPNPLLFVNNCHINAFVSCISLSNVVQFDISHNVLYASKPRAPLAADVAKTGFVAISVSMHENVGLTSRIVGNTIIGTTPIDIPKNGIYVDGERSEFSLSIDGNELIGWDTAVILGRGSRGVVVTQSNRYRSNRDMVIDMGGLNVVASENASQDGYARNESGLDTRWGTTVVTFDASGHAKLTLAPAFKSKFLFGISANGDHTSIGRTFVMLDDLKSTPNEIHLQATPAPGNTPIRVQWIAIGV